MHLVLALGPEDEQGRPEVGISEGPAENDHASFDKAVDEGRVLVPTGLAGGRESTSWPSGALWARAGPMERWARRVAMFIEFDDGAAVRRFSAVGSGRT